MYTKINGIQPDYSKMSLREELEIRLAQLEDEQASQQTALPRVPLSQPQKLPEQEISAWDKIYEAATPIYVGAKGAAQGAYSATQNMVNQLYQGGEAFGEKVAQIGNTIAEIRNDYFLPRTAYNRYKIGCTPSNIVYNGISSLEQMSPPRPIYSVLAPVQRFDLTSVKDWLLYLNRYFRTYKTGESAAKYTANLYNALDEANCL